MKQRIVNIAIIVTGFVIIAVASFIIESMKKTAATTDAARRVSVVYTDETGARASYLVARKFLQAEPWRRPLEALPLNDNKDDEDELVFYRRPPRVRGKTLLVADPDVPLSPAEADALDRWIRAGGQLVLTVDRDWPISDSSDQFLKRHGITISTPAAANEPQQDAEASSHQGQAGNELPREVVPVHSPGGHTLALSLPKGATLSSRFGPDESVLDHPLGEGRIIVIPDGHFISNSTIRGNDNVALIVHLVQDGGGRLLFDEYHHGFGERAGAWALAATFMASPWGWMVGTLAVAGMLYTFGIRRRFGRIVDPRPVSRQSPLDLIDARASLFRMVAARALAIENICQNVEAELARSQGRPMTLADLAGSPGMTCQAELARLDALRQHARRSGRNGVGNQDVVQAAMLAGRIFREASID